MQQVIKGRYFLAPAFEIYGSVAGLYDLGPLATRLRINMLDLWRDFFVLEDDLQEIVSTCLVPERVLRASGHV